MTENEAIKILTDRHTNIGTTKCDDVAWRKLKPAIDTAVNALEEIQQYRAIGTVEQIKKLVRFLSLDNDNGIIEDMELLNQYKFIGTVEECQEAREKQRAKKYKIIEPCKSVTYYQCPHCNGLLYINENFCGECGHAIDWEDLN